VIKQKGLCCIFALLIVGAAYGRSTMQLREETVCGIPVKVLSEYRSSFEIQFIYLAIPDESYS
jgi:hypothetical protein